LDLGRVGNVAAVELNDNNVGTVWIRDQVLDITKAVRHGRNRLVIVVTNTLINRVSGLEEPVPIPGDLVDHYGSDTTAHSASFRGSIGFRPLPASGLLGPVRILAAKRVDIALK
ncbi:MAG TPA: hypothetical protein PLZ55_09815, partial [bacterium]|nr:hypothetical protein [bacterium]